MDNAVKYISLILNELFSSIAGVFRSLWCPKRFALYDVPTVRMASIALLFASFCVSVSELALWRRLPAVVTGDCGTALVFTSEQGLSDARTAAHFLGTFSLTSNAILIFAFSIILAALGRIFSKSPQVPSIKKAALTLSFPVSGCLLINAISVVSAIEAANAPFLPTPIYAGVAVFAIVAVGYCYCVIPLVATKTLFQLSWPRVLTVIGLSLFLYLPLQLVVDPIGWRQWIVGDASSVHSSNAQYTEAMRELRSGKGDLAITRMEREAKNNPEEILLQVGLAQVLTIVFVDEYNQYQDQFLAPLRYLEHADTLPTDERLRNLRDLIKTTGDPRRREMLAHVRRLGPQLWTHLRDLQSRFKDDSSIQLFVGQCFMWSCSHSEARVAFQTSLDAPGGLPFHRVVAAHLLAGLDHDRDNHSMLHRFNENSYWGSTRIRHATGWVQAVLTISHDESDLRSLVHPAAYVARITRDSARLCRKTDGFCLVGPM